MMSQAVLVTGGSGFIGSWVLQELFNVGAQPIVLDVQPSPERWRRILGANADRLTFEAGSLLDRDLLQEIFQKYSVEHVIHLAALLTPACQQDPFAGCQINVLGSVALLEAMRLSGRPVRGFSYASSYAVYGPEPGDALDDRGGQLNRPPSFYGAFKQAVDVIVEQYWRHFGIAAVGIRPHVVYGPERDQGLTAGPSLAVRAALKREPFTISYRGRLGYDYVEDVARAFVRSALATPPGANIVDLLGESATTEEFAATIAQCVPGADALLKVAGPEIPSNVPPHPHYIDRLYSDWRATSLLEGVRKTIEFYASRG